MAADDDPLAGLSPEWRAYLRPGKPQQGAPAAPASTTAAPATTAPSGTSTSTATPPPGGYSIFNPDPTGVQHAIETGFGQGFRTVLNAPADWINRATGWQPYQFTMPLTAEEQQGQQAHPVAAGIGRFGGEALAGAPAALVGGEVLGAASAVPYIGRAVANPLVSGAIQGATQNALTSAGSPDQPIGYQMLTGAGFGAAGGAVGSRIGRMFGRDASLASQAVQDAGNTAKSAGIDVLPGNLPQAGATAAQKGAPATPGQMQQVNRAFGNIVGGNVDDFSAKNLGPLTNSVGSEVSTAVNQGQVQMTRQLASDLQDVVQNARQPGIDPLVRAKIENEVGKVMQIAPNMGDTISGQQFDRLVGRGSRLSNFVGDNNKDLSDLAHQLDTALDNGFQASSPAGVYGQYVDAKTRFRLLKAIEDNVEGDASGNIKPGTIMSDINRRFPNMPTQTGQSTVGQASDLARAVTTLFGGGQGAPGAAPTTIGSLIRQHPLLAGAGGVGGLYQVASNPASVGALLGWGATHLPVVIGGGGLLAAEEILRRGGRAYQRTPAFANALLRRGTQAPGNPYGAYLGAGAAALPPDRGQPSP